MTICKKVKHKGKYIKLMVYFSEETTNTRRIWSHVFRVLKENNCNQIVVPNKVLLNSERRSTDLSEKGKTKGTDGH